MKCLVYQVKKESFYNYARTYWVFFSFYFSMSNEVPVGMATNLQGKKKGHCDYTFITSVRMSSFPIIISTGGKERNKNTAECFLFLLVHTNDFFIAFFYVYESAVIVQQFRTSWWFWFSVCRVINVDRRMGAGPGPLMRKWN